MTTPVPSVAEVPPFFKLDDAPKYGGPERTKMYSLLKQRKIRARKLGRLTMIEGASFVTYMTSLPSYEPGAAL